MGVDQKISFGVARYDDDSGNRFDVIMESTNEGRAERIELTQGTHTLYITFEEWALLRKSIDDGVSAFKKLSHDLYTSPAIAERK